MPWRKRWFIAWIKQYQDAPRLRFIKNLVVWTDTDRIDDANKFIVGVLDSIAASRAVLGPAVITASPIQLIGPNDVLD